MKKTTLVVKPTHRKHKMTPAELAEYYEHGRGRTRVSEDRKAYKRARDKKRLPEE